MGMIKIAICDDRPEERERIRKYVEEYGEAKQILFEIFDFSYPDTLLCACQKEVFHIYLLDIVMPMMDGITLGNTIRKHDGEAVIIYITTEAQYAFSAYSANPLNYLLKPVEKDKFFETLDLAVGKSQDIKDMTFPVKTGHGVRVLKVMEVVCGEYVNHTVVFTLISGVQIQSSTIAGKFADYIADFLADVHFIQPHISYLVNMKYIEQFEKDAFLVRGNIRVPISARNYGTVRDIYMDYLMGEK